MSFDYFWIRYDRHEKLKCNEKASHTNSHVADHALDSRVPFWGQSALRCRNDSIPGKANLKHKAHTYNLRNVLLKFEAIVPDEFARSTPRLFGWGIHQPSQGPKMMQTRYLRTNAGLLSPPYKTWAICKWEYFVPRSAGRLPRHRAEARGFQEWQLQHVRELMPPGNFLVFHKDRLKGWRPANIFLALRHQVMTTARGRIPKPLADQSDPTWKDVISGPHAHLGHARLVLKMHWWRTYGKRSTHWSIS